MGTGFYMGANDGGMGGGKAKRRVSLVGDIEPDEPEMPALNPGRGALVKAVRAEVGATPDWRKHYPNVELGPVAQGNGGAREFKNSLESEIKAHQRAVNTAKEEEAFMGYPNIKHFRQVDHSTLPGEAARRDMNERRNWQTQRDETGDKELFSRKAWQERGLKEWVRSPEFDKNQSARKAGWLPTTDSKEFGEQVKWHMLDHMYDAREKDDRMSGFYTDAYTGLPMPILNEHSSELDKAGAFFWEELLKRNPGVRTWSAMKDLDRHGYTGDKRALASFLQKWAENGADALTLETFLTGGAAGGSGRLGGAGEYWGKSSRFFEGLEAVPPRAPGVVGRLNGASQRKFSEMVGRLKHVDQLPAGTSGGTGADILSARLKGSSLVKEGLNLKNLTKLAGELDYPSPYGGANFYSGGPVARAQAEAAAKANRGVTLELTPNGKMLDEMKLYPPKEPLPKGVVRPLEKPLLTPDEADQVWGAASLKYVDGVTGTPTAFLTKRLRDKALWFQEKARLKARSLPIREVPVKD